MHYSHNTGGCVNLEWTGVKLAVSVAALPILFTAERVTLLPSKVGVVGWATTVLDRCGQEWLWERVLED